MRWIDVWGIKVTIKLYYDNNMISTFGIFAVIICEIYVCISVSLQARRVQWSSMLTGGVLQSEEGAGRGRHLYLTWTSPGLRHQPGHSGKSRAQLEVRGHPWWPGQGDRQKDQSAVSVKTDPPSFPLCTAPTAPTKIIAIDLKVIFSRRQGCI